MSAKNSKLVLKATNELLDYLKDLPEVPCGMPPTSFLITHLNVSRTTVQKLIEILCNKGIARQDGTNKILLRKPQPSDYFSVEQMDNSKSDIVEKQIIRLLSSYVLKPGDRFSELELSRKLNTNTVIIREALSKIAQSGIINKNPRQKWEVVEFSLPLIEEIAAVRKLYEGYAIRNISTSANIDPIWKDLLELEKQHCKLLKVKIITPPDMRNIERSFHTTIVSASHNRFIISSYNSIFTLIFFHLGQIEYDQEKIRKVLNQHLGIIKALLAKDLDKALNAMELHLDHAKLSMKSVNQLLENENTE